MKNLNNILANQINELEINFIEQVEKLNNIEDSFNNSIIKLRSMLKSMDYEWHNLPQMVDILSELKNITNKLETITFDEDVVVFESLDTISEEDVL